MKKFLLLFALSITLLPLSAAPDAPKNYAVLKLDGAVNPIVADYLSDSIQKSADGGVSFIVIQMDTPGGLMTSMRKIIKSILTSPVPVIVYTFPKGAQAASAGGFIMLASHIAVMAPGTEIGAMHPVSPQLDFLKKDKSGGPAGIMEKKVLNDTIAYARSLAQKRGRNTVWTERAVREAISSTYTEAQKAGVIDFVAEDMNDLLVKLDGRRVNINGRRVVLHTAGAVPLYFSMTWKQKLLNRFADPQVMFLLFIIAAVGIGMEFKNPGMIIPGAVGGLALIIFLLAVQIIPINAMGLILILLAVVLFVLELQFTSYGLLTIGGIVSFVLGSMILFDSPLPGGHIPLSSIIAAVIFILAFVFVVIRLILNAHKSRVTTGIEGLIGESAEPLESFSGRGRVRVHGEIWNAHSEDAVSPEDALIVSQVRGMELIVRRK